MADLKLICDIWIITIIVAQITSGTVVMVESTNQICLLKSITFCNFADDNIKYSDSKYNIYGGFYLEWQSMFMMEFKQNIEHWYKPNT